MNKVMKKLILNAEQQRKIDFIQESPYSDFSPLLDFQIEDLAIYWSFYSGKIEGNTFSFVETETLLKDDVTPTRSYEDAVMLKNLYNAFISCVNQIKKEGNMEISSFNVKGLHAMISDGLLPTQNRGQFRTMPIKITGTPFIPEREPVAIENTFQEILAEQYDYDNPISRSIFLHCNIARLQPFIDGNKRTSRLVESIALMNANIIPVRSDKEKDFLRYRDAIVHFYENEDYTPYIEYALDIQIQRINELAPEKDQYGTSHDIGFKR